MTVFPPSIDKLSAFRHRDVVKYVQSVHRAAKSQNVYSYEFEHIDKLIVLLNGLEDNSKDKIMEAQELLFREIAMCDNYVKLSMEAYQTEINVSDYWFIREMVGSLAQMYVYYFQYREALYDQAELLDKYKGESYNQDVTKLKVGGHGAVDVRHEISQINNNIYEIANSMRPEYYVTEYTETDIVKTYTPYNVDIDDVAAVWFENVIDYNYILERCKNTETCVKLTSSNIKLVKDLYHTFFSAGIKAIYDLLQTGDTTDDIGILIRKIHALLFLDIKLRDCQSKQLVLDTILEEPDSEGADGHLQWRQAIWADATILYDIAPQNNTTRLYHISQMFDRVLSNTNNKHRDQNIYNTLARMQSKDLIASLSRFIPG